MATKIPWCDDTINPLPGCTNNLDPQVCPLAAPRCYAERTAKSRLKGTHGYPEDDPFRPGILRLKQLEKLAKWKKGRVVFVNSMGDMWSEGVRRIDVITVLDAMADNPQHQYVFLTKRPDRMVDIIRSWAFIRARINIAGGVVVPDNWWPGVSAWDQPSFDRNVGELMKLGSPNSWVSLEPLLKWVFTTPFDNTTFRLDKLAQVVVGGENGPQAQPMHAEWVRSMLNDCRAANVPFFFKGWGTNTPRVEDGCTGRLLDGVEHNDLAWRV